MPMSSMKSLLAAAITLIGIPLTALPPAHAQSWPTRPVKFIVPFGPGAGADIGARLFAEKLTQKWGQPVVIENKPGGDSNVKEFTEAARAKPGTFNYGAVPGITEFIFWGYLYDQKLQMAQVPYRDINVAPVDLSEGRLQAVMASYAIVQPQVQAGRIKLFVVNNKTRIKAAPDMPTAREQGFPSLEMEGLVGLFGLKSMSEELKEKIAADFRAVAADGSIAERLKSTGQAINIGGPKEFVESIDEQRRTVAATAKAINYKPKN